MSRVLVIPDCHLPYHYKDLIHYLKSQKQLLKPDRVVFLGDLIDAHALSRWTHDPDLKSAGDEIISANETLKEIYKIFPVANLCLGNHDIRGGKKALDCGIPRIFIRELRDVLNMPDGWNVEKHHIIDGVLYWHGDGLSSKTALLASLNKKKQSNVFGHCHGMAGVVYQNDGLTTRLAMNAGCLVDIEAMAYLYAENSEVKASLGSGIVFDGIRAIWHPL